MTNVYDQKGKRKNGSFYHLQHIAQYNKSPIQCFKCNTEKKLHRDHIKPLWDHGEDKLDNLQILCEKCHQIKTKQEENQRKNATQQKEEHPSRLWEFV